MQKKIISGLVVMLVLGVGFYFFYWRAKAIPEPAGAILPMQASPTVSVATGETTFTPEQIQTHNSAVSCYVAIAGQVYDLTTWINQHPGGPERILNICGTDATVAFNAQHSGQRRPAEELAHFRIGRL